MNLAMILIGKSIVLLVFVIPIILLTTAFWIWMLISAIQNKGLNDTEKICWVLAILFLHVLGALLYFVIIDRQRGQAPALHGAMGGGENPPPPKSGA